MIARFFSELTKKQKRNIVRITISILFLLASEKLSEYDYLKYISYICFIISYITIGYDVLLKAFKGIKKLQPFDENFLMAIATIGAIAMGDMTEGVAVMIFYQVGELFESIAVGKSRRNIAELIDIRPDYANVELNDGEITKVDPYDVKLGTIIVIKPGEKIPIDGKIIDGSSSLDVAALTGESKQKDVTVGSEVLSGSINVSGLIKVETTKEFSESTASKILDLVENASSRKSKSEDFISKFARVYTPAVCFSAMALAVLPPVVSLILCNPPKWGEWIYRALTFLVISCPCALVISIPLTFFAGLGGASKNGILIKGSNFMEPLSKSTNMVFDKTGTMTKGVFEVRGIHHNPIDEDKLVDYAAHAECFSNHPISISILRYYGKETDITRVKDVHEISGEGVTAIVDGHKIACGNEKLMKREKVSFAECNCHGTKVHVAIDGKYSGHILIADTLKDNAKQSINEMRKIGVKKTVMLTGDENTIAEHVANELGIDEVYSQLLPADKVNIVERIIEKQSKKEHLSFIGDGVNDAPVLSRADVGIAMGGIGSDAAIEAADVVLMDDDPLKIVKAIKISRKCMKIVYENIYGAIGIKLVCLALGAFGIAGMWIAIFADTGVLVIAVINAMRALNVRNI